MSKRILVCHGGGVISALWKNGEIIQLDIDETTESPLLGSIYIGKVKNIVKNIRAAFVEIGGGQICYYSLEHNPLPIFMRGANRTAVCIGDEIVVQVVKEGMKTKEPMVSSKLNLSGRYAVLIHGGNLLAFSKKIKDILWKNQMKQKIKIEEFPGVEILIRTNALYAKEEEVMEELNQLYGRYQKLIKEAPYRTVYSCLFSQSAQYLRTVRDTYSDELEEIITDDRKILRQIQAYFEQQFPGEIQKIHFYEDRLLPLDKYYGIETCIQKALQERVWLKSGAYLIIQPTEALVAIDVNTGKAITGKQAEEETFFRINQEAAAEIMKQLRLRNLSGIILIDFINMKTEEYKKKLIEQMRRLAGEDPIKTVVVDMTQLDLMEVTRKKEKRPLHEYKI